MFVVVICSKTTLNTVWFPLLSRTLLLIFRSYACGECVMRELTDRKSGDTSTSLVWDSNRDSFFKQPLLHRIHSIVRALVWKHHSLELEWEDKFGTLIFRFRWSLPVFYTLSESTLDLIRTSCSFADMNMRCYSPNNTYAGQKLGLLSPRA